MDIHVYTQFHIQVVFDENVLISNLEIQGDKSIGRPQMATHMMVNYSTNCVDFTSLTGADDRSVVSIFNHERRVITFQ